MNLIQNSISDCTKLKIKYKTDINLSERIIHPYTLVFKNNIWYLYAGNSGFIKTDARKLSKMLEHGWYSKNDRFNEILDEELSINTKK